MGITEEDWLVGGAIQAIRQGQYVPRDAVDGIPVDEVGDAQPASRRLGRRLPIRPDRSETPHRSRSNRCLERGTRDTAPFKSAPALAARPVIAPPPGP